MTKLGYLGRQNCDKSQILCHVNGLKFLSIEKLFSRFVMTLSQENPQSQEFLKPTVTWISLIFSKSRDLILISLDRIHYYQVLDKIHWQINQGNVCVWCLSYITESSEILYEIDHDLTMIDKYIFVTTPVPFYFNFSFFVLWLFISCK